MVYGAEGDKSIRFVMLNGLFLVCKMYNYINNKQGVCNKSNPIFKCHNLGVKWAA